MLQGLNLAERNYNGRWPTMKGDGRDAGRSEGSRIGGPDSPFRAEMFQANGASTAPIAFGEFCMAVR